MKNFKLIKIYPGNNFKIGDIISDEGSEYIADYPEFWEEIIEKNYEILSFICISSNSTGEESAKLPNGKHYWKNGPYKENLESRFLNDKDYTIHSIKRL